MGELERLSGYGLEADNRRMPSANNRRMLSARRRFS
jgi:hypothetical protein